MLIIVKTVLRVNGSGVKKWLVIILLFLFCGCFEVSVQNEY